VNEIAVPLRSRRRETALVVQKFQHVIPAPVLIQDGLHRLAEPASGVALALGAGEVAAGALVVGAFILAVRQAYRARKAPHVHLGVDWVDIFLGLMLLVEVLVHREETGHIRRPTLLLAATMLVFGILHGRIATRAVRHFTLRVDDDGVRAGARFFRTFKVRWADIAEIAVDDGSGRIVTRDGRRRTFAFGALAQPAEVRDALVAARTRWQAQLDAAGH
jgi:hypothetical protein